MYSNIFKYIPIYSNIFQSKHLKGCSGPAWVTLFGEFPFLDTLGLKQGSRSAQLSPQSMTILQVHVKQCASSDGVKVNIPVE